ASRGERARVLELGCGVGNDAFGFLRSDLVESYAGVDVSREALAVFQRRLRRGRPHGPVLLHCTDFLDVLGRPDGAAAAATLVYSYSSLHYFSSGELARIYALVRSLLAASAGPGGGSFAFGIKGQGSVWDGQGLPLYRPDVWVNWDGQSRWFPSREALVRQLDRAGFEVRFHELHDHWGYSELGKRDVFHYVLLTPRTPPPKSA
ncbi:MAG: methyltransferase domain-containing protein, partial [Myxococcales bacterium]